MRKWLVVELLDVSIEVKVLAIAAESIRRHLTWEMAQVLADWFEEEKGYNVRDKLKNLVSLQRLYYRTETKLDNLSVEDRQFAEYEDDDEAIDAFHEEKANLQARLTSLEKQFNDELRS